MIQTILKKFKEGAMSKKIFLTSAALIVLLLFVECAGGDH